MRKKILIFMTLFASAACALADNTVSVGSALIPQGKTGSFTIELTNTDAFASSMELHLTLPEGITFEGVALTDRITDNPSLSSSVNGQDVTITTLSGTNAAITGTSGPLFIVNVSADAGLEVGSKLTASVTFMELAKKVANGHEKWNPTPFDFKIEITDKVVLDENSPAVPIATDEEVAILVKRTIKANQWSTICLPFDMTEEQIVSAFGNDTQLALFDSYLKNDDGSITVNFEESSLEDGLVGNYPYIIKTSKEISEFEVDAVVTPDEENAIAEYIVGRKPKQRTAGTFTGTLHAGTLIPAENLFLSDNKFYYSVGKTKSKAFRAYFWFEDLLPDVSSADSRIALQVSNGSFTNIIFNRMDKYQVSPYYDLTGRRVEKPVKGLYIHNGRKEVVR